MYVDLLINPKTVLLWSTAALKIFAPNLKSFLMGFYNAVVKFGNYARCFIGFLTTLDNFLSNKSKD